MRNPAITMCFLGAVGLGCGESWTGARLHHCAVQDGDEWCNEQHPDGSRPYCRRGFCGGDGLEDPALLDGCVSQQPPELECYSPCGNETNVLEDLSCFDPGRVTAEPEIPGDPDEGPPDGGGEHPTSLCGNGTLDPDEWCDDGTANGEPGACARDCQGGTTGFCGDGEAQTGEACDDGNALEGDGCNPDCRESGTVIWERTLATNGVATGVDISSDGSIYLAGRRSTPPSGAWAARLNPDGEIEWIETEETPPGTAQPNSLVDAHVVDDGTVVFSGRRDDRGWVLQMTADGAPLDSFSDPGSSLLRSVLSLQGGGWLAKRDGRAVRLTPSFSTQWESVFGEGLAFRPESSSGLVAVLNVGFIRFTGSGAAYETVLVPGLDRFFGNTTNVAWTSDGDIVLAGSVAYGGARDVLVVRSAVDGNIRWVHGIDSLGSQVRQADCLVVDEHDGIVAGGNGLLFGATVPFLVKLSPDGDVLWTSYPRPSVTYGRIWGCAVSPTNEIAVVGEADGDTWAAKLTP